MDLLEAVICWDMLHQLLKGPFLSLYTGINLLNISNYQPLNHFAMLTLFYRICRMGKGMVTNGYK